MTDPIVKVREHYSPAGLTDRIKAALATIAPESQALKFAPLTDIPHAGHSRHRRIGSCRWARSIDARAGCWLRNRRASALSRRNFCVQGDRNRPEPCV